MRDLRDILVSVVFLVVITVWIAFMLSENARCEARGGKQVWGTGLSWACVREVD